MKFIMGCYAVITHIPLKITSSVSFPASFSTAQRYSLPLSAPSTSTVKLEVSLTTTLSYSLVQVKLFPGPPMAEQVKVWLTFLSLLTSCGNTNTLPSGETAQEEHIHIHTCTLYRSCSVCTCECGCFRGGPRVRCGHTLVVTLIAKPNCSDRVRAIRTDV